MLAKSSWRSFLEQLTLNLAGLDVVRDGLWAAAIDLAAGGESSTKDLLDGTLEVLGHGLEPHLAGDLNDLVKRNRLSVLDVLLFLAVPWWLLKGLDDEGGGRWDDGDGGLTVLDGELDRHAETFLKELLAIAGIIMYAGSFLPSHRWPWRYLHRPSWGRDQEDRSLGPERKRHQPHHQWPSGG